MELLQGRLEAAAAVADASGLSLMNLEAAVRVEDSLGAWQYQVCAPEVGVCRVQGRMGAPSTGGRRRLVERIFVRGRKLLCCLPGWPLCATVYPPQYDKGGPARATPLPPAIVGPLLDVARLSRDSARLLDRLAEARREAGSACDQGRLLALRHSRCVQSCTGGWGSRLAARRSWPMRVTETSHPPLLRSDFVPANPQALSPFAHILRRLADEALALQSKADKTGKKAEAAEEAWGHIQVRTWGGG